MNSTKTQIKHSTATDGKPPVVGSFRVGQVVKKGRSNFIITKVNKKTLTLRQFWDRAVRGTNRRRMTFGDFYTADISDVRR